MILLVVVIVILAESDNEKSELPVVTNPETVSAAPVQKVGDEPPVYTVIEEKNSSFGHIRSRISLNTELPEALTDRNKIRAMMAAVVARHRKNWPDAISVRLWRSYESDGTALNRIVYAPDGCGWAGDNCSQPSGPISCVEHFRLIWLIGAAPPKRRSKRAKS